MAKKRKPPRPSWLVPGDPLPEGVFCLIPIYPDMTQSEFDEAVRQAIELRAERSAIVRAVRRELKGDGEEG